MVTNLGSGTYSVWVTPDGGSETQIADNYAFRAGAPSVDDLGKVQLVSANGYDDTFQVENHSVSGSSTPTPTPTPTPKPGGSTITLQAESYNSSYGISNYGTVIGCCYEGYWVCYNDVNLGNGYATFTANAARGASGTG